MRKPRVMIVNVLIISAFILGLWQLGQGTLIHAKAYLAQRLLDRAWQQSLAADRVFKPWSWADTYPVGQLQVPSLGIEQIVLAGASGRTLAFAPGHVLASSPLGERGTSVISAHRDTHFRFLKDLARGDRIDITTRSGEHLTYTISEIQVVNVHEAKLNLASNYDQLVLVTCYPFDVIAATGDLRYVVTAMLHTEAVGAL